jgi:hypothetical protein
MILQVDIDVPDKGATLIFRVEVFLRNVDIPLQNHVLSEITVPRDEPSPL